MKSVLRVLSLCLVVCSGASKAYSAIVVDPNTVVAAVSDAGEKSFAHTYCMHSYRLDIFQQNIGVIYSREFDGCGDLDRINSEVSRINSIFVKARAKIENVKIGGAIRDFLSELTWGETIDTPVKIVSKK